MSDRKYGRNDDKCRRYKESHRSERNKARKVEKLKAHLTKAKARKAKKA